MKKILTLILILQINFIMAGNLPNVMIDPENPIVNQNVDVIVLGGDCSGPTNPPEYVVNVQSNEIKVFVRFINGSICPDPPPPPQARYGLGAVINGLPEGDYNLQYYILGVADDLPPLPVDEQGFFIEEIQFEVRGSAGAISVNTLSFIGVMAMIFMMLGIGFVSGIKNK